MTTVAIPVTVQPAASRTDSDDCTTTTSRLKIASRQELREFLRAIQPEFLRVVDPRESGLLDILHAADLLTETDNESMSGKDVNIRKDQARKLWFLLNKLAVDDFLAEVGPVLLKMFPHIIPEMYLTQELNGAHDRKDVHKDCLRHDIMSRIRAPTIADMLYRHDCLTFEDYEDIASGEYDDDIVWGKMFDSIIGHSDDMTMQIVEALQALLDRYKVPVSCSLTDLVSRGVPCLCGRANFILPASPAFQLRKVGSWVKKSQFQQSPRSSGSSVTRVDLTSYSGTASLRSNDSRSLGSDLSLSESAASFPVPKKKASIVGQTELLPTLEETATVALPTDQVFVITVEESRAPDKPALLDAACLSGQPHMSCAGKSIDHSQLAGIAEEGLSNDSCGTLNKEKEPGKDSTSVINKLVSGPSPLTYALFLTVFSLFSMIKAGVIEGDNGLLKLFQAIVSYVNHLDERLQMIEESLKEQNQNMTL